MALSVGGSLLEFSSHTANSIRQVAPMCTHIWCRNATVLLVEIHLRTILGIELYTLTVRSVDVRLSLKS